MPENGGIFDIKVYAGLEYMYRRDGEVNDLTDIEKHEIEVIELDGKGKYYGSFQDQFPVLERPKGHNPNT